MANYKGINELITAFERLKLRHSNIKLLLIGPFEDLNPLDNSTLDYINEDADIIHVGFQSDIRPFLSITDVFVFPSYREGFPQSLMQASSMKLPLIATDINGCNEIVKNNFSGLLIKSKSVDELENAMNYLINHEDIRNRFAIQGYSFISENFEQKKFWNSLLKFYSDNL